MINEESISQIIGPDHFQYKCIDNHNTYSTENAIVNITVIPVDDIVGDIAIYNPYSNDSINDGETLFLIYQQNKFINISGKLSNESSFDSNIDSNNITFSDTYFEPDGISNAITTKWYRSTDDTEWTEFNPNKTISHNAISHTITSDDYNHTIKLFCRILIKTDLKTVSKQFHYKGLVCHLQYMDFFSESGFVKNSSISLISNKNTFMKIILGIILIIPIPY